MPKLVNARTVCALLLSICLILVSHYILDGSEPASGPGILSLLIREIGFALMVAIVIWGVFEYFSAEETESNWNRRVETMTKNVFFGVLGKNLPRDLIEEAHVLLLDQNFIRSGFHVNYVLTDDVFTRQDGTKAPYVRVDATARYKMINIGSTPIDCPVAIGLPNPIISGLKEKCGVNRLIVKLNGNSKNVNLTEGEKKFREALKKDGDMARFVGPTVSIAPNQPCEIVWDYVMAKEEEDTEIGQTLYPMDSLSITVVDRNPGKRAVHARSIHPAELEDDTSAKSQGTYNFRLNRYVLPHQGFMIWWKKVAAGAEPEIGS